LAMLWATASARRLEMESEIALEFGLAHELAIQLELTTGKRKTI